MIAERFATLLDRLLVAYGYRIYHPGGWRVVDALMPLTRSTWKYPRVVKRRGIWYELDLRSYIPRVLYYHGEYERWSTRFLVRAVNAGWVVADVGANIGYYSLLMARQVGPGGLVYAFEPATSTHRALVRNLALNNAVKVRAYRLALSDTVGEALLVPGPLGNPGLTHLSITQNDGGEVVPLTTLDQFVEEQDVKQLNFIKVDIEGAERRFLAGAAQTLVRFRPTILIEFNSSTLKEFGSLPDDLARDLKGAEYCLYRPSRRGLRPLRDLPISPLRFNVVALPLERFAGDSLEKLA